MNETEILQSYFQTQFPFNKDGLIDFANSFQLKTYKKGEIILGPNTIDHKLRFLIRGQIREYYATTTKAININFYVIPDFITDFGSFENNSPSRKWQETLSDVELLVLHKNDFTKLLTKYPCGVKFIDTIFKRITESREILEYNRLIANPEELYRWIVQNKKEWLKKIAQYHIALFMGITPETLSRIRKKIY